MIIGDVQPATYGNMQTCDVDADGLRRGDGDAVVYANIEPSATAAPLYRNDEAAQHVVYSELHSP